MGGLYGSPISANGNVLNLSFANATTTAVPPTFCGGLESLQSPTAGPGFLLITPSYPPPVVSPGLTSFFLPRPVDSGGRPLPDHLEDLNSGALERLAREGHDRDARFDVERLVNDFPACNVHNLNRNFERLPPLFQMAWLGYADDPAVGFRIDFVTSDDGQTIPQATLVPAGSDRAEGSLDLRLDDLSVGAAGILVARRGLSPDPEPGIPNGRGPSLMSSNPYLGSAVTVGASTLIFLAVDRQVQAMDLPPSLRGIVATGETFGIYEGLGRLGVIERPRWGQVVRSAPHLALLQIGSSHVYDALGWSLGSNENNLASFVTTTGVYTLAPRLATRYAPRLANLYRASIGLAPEGGALASFRGAGLVGGALRYVAGPVGAVFLIDWLGGSLGQFLVWASDGFSDPAPDTALWRAAREAVYAEYADPDRGVGGFAGWSARNLPFINKAALGWTLALSSDFRRDMRNAQEDVIDRWVSGTRDFGQAVDNVLLLGALQASEQNQSGRIGVNWENYQRLVREFYARRNDAVTAGYAADRMLRRTRRADEIANASAVIDLIASDGDFRSREDVASRVSSVLDAARADGRLRSMLQDLIREERNAYRNRLGELNLLDGQTGRPRTTAELNLEQRAFLHGVGRTSESITRRRRIEVLTQLFRGLEAGSQPIDIIN